jgi:hypothetical protein
LEQRLYLEEKQNWVTNMIGYEFEIIYKKGKNNIVVDALLRKEEEIDGSLCSIFIMQYDWVEEEMIE